MLRNMNGSDQLYELRTYHVAPAKLEALIARFRDHTEALFARHHLHAIGYWVSRDSEAPELVYIMRHANQEDAEKNWAAFGNDPDWKKIKAETDKDGPLALRIDRLFMTPTDFSRLR
jgi:hypothetical protein